MTRGQTCEVCNEHKPLSAFTRDKTGNRITYRKKCKECRKKERTDVKIQQHVNDVRDLHKTVNTFHITRVIFEASEDPSPLKVGVLVTNARLLLASFLKQQEILDSVFGNRLSQSEEQMDDYHSVLGEEMDMRENTEGIY